MKFVQFAHEDLDFISTDELMKTAKELGMEMDDEQAAEFIKDFDNNGNGKIEFSGKL